MTPFVGLWLLSALCFGLADFLGGLLSRRSHSVTVSLIAHLTGIALVQYRQRRNPNSHHTRVEWLLSAFAQSMVSPEAPPQHLHSRRRQATFRGLGAITTSYGNP